MDVQIDLYSGRPNPGWRLGAAQSTELIRRLKEMPEVEKGEPAQALGYRGIVVTTRTDAPAELKTIVVSGGLVLERYQNGVERRRIDRGRSLERWILETGRNHLDPAIYKIIDQELAH